jgi:hypothetical protein
MNQISQFSAPDSQSAPSHWIGRVLIAVLVAEGIWGLIVSLTRDLIVPFLARQMGGDPQSPLYLGKGEFNIPGIFTAVLQFCVAGLVAVILNVWVRRPAKVTRRTLVRTGKGVVAPSVAPRTIAPASVVPAGIYAAPGDPVLAVAPLPASQPASPVAPKPPASPQPPAAQAPKPAKPKTPREIQYNIVGEPISPMEEDE